MKTLLKIDYQKYLMVPNEKAAMLMEILTQCQMVKDVTYKKKEFMPCEDSDGFEILLIDDRKFPYLTEDLTQAVRNDESEASHV